MNTDNDTSHGMLTFASFCCRTRYVWLNVSKIHMAIVGVVQANFLWMWIFIMVHSHAICHVSFVPLNAYFWNKQRIIKCYMEKYFELVALDAKNNTNVPFQHEITSFFVPLILTSWCHIKRYNHCSSTTIHCGLHLYIFYAIIIEATNFWCHAFKGIITLVKEIIQHCKC